MKTPTSRSPSVSEGSPPSRTPGRLPAQAANPLSHRFLKLQISNSKPAITCAPMHPTPDQPATRCTPTLHPGAVSLQPTPIPCSKTHNLHPHAVTQPNHPPTARTSLPHNLITFGWRYQKRGSQDPELDNLRRKPPKTRFPQKQPDHLRPALSKTRFPPPETQNPNPTPEQIRQAQPFLWKSPPFSRIMPDSTFYRPVLKNGAQ